MINKSKKLLRNIALASCLGLVCASMMLPATAMARGRHHGHGHYHHYHWRRHSYAHIVIWNPRPCWRCDPYYYGPQPVVYRRVVFHF